MKKLINVCIILLAFGFYTVSNCYFPISPSRPFKMYLDNDTPYTVKLGYKETGDTLDKKVWDFGDSKIAQNTKELIFWKRWGKVENKKTHTFTLTATVKNLKFALKIELRGKPSKRNLLFSFPSRPKLINAKNFRKSKIPEYAIGKIKGKNIVLSVIRSRSYGSGINRYGVIVFKLDVE